MTLLQLGKGTSCGKTQFKPHIPPSLGPHLCASKEGEKCPQHHILFLDLVSRRHKGAPPGLMAPGPA